jgi:hypothetical protein
MTLETTSPRRLRLLRAPPSLVQELDRVYTQRPRVAGLLLENGALNRGSDTRRCHRHSTRKSGEVFRPERQAPLQPLAAES